MIPSPFRLKETVPPGAEPVSLDDMKAHLRVDHAADDGLVLGMIKTAREACERVTGKSLITRSYSLFLDDFPPTFLELPKPPLVSVTQILTYDAASASTVYAAGNYFVDTASQPGRVYILSGSAFPSPGRDINGIEIQYKAGFGIAPDDIPALFQHGIKTMAAHLYMHRSDTVDEALIGSGAFNVFLGQKRLSLL